MNEIYSKFQTGFTAVGALLGGFLGGLDGLLIALCIACGLDYILGVMCAIKDKKLSSEVGMTGIMRKFTIFLLVGFANVLDVYVVPGEGSTIRTAMIFFYFSNEGISLLENASHLGLAIPKKIQDVLEQLHKRNDEDDDSVGAKATDEDNDKSKKAKPDEEHKYEKSKPDEVSEETNDAK